MIVASATVGAGLDVLSGANRRWLTAACGAALSAMTQSAAAQDATPEMRGAIRIEVTGSHIARTDAESPLPIQLITREEIERGDWSTAAELMAHVSANFNGMNNQLSIGRSGNPGLSSANLRGLGDGNTLVLLNGRRLANYAFLSGTVNLNAIPLAAIDRVEILKDGASSIYGSDAIAGVVNFVTRKDYSGMEATGQANVTQHHGGDHYQATVTAGYGDLARDRFNAFVTIDWQKDVALAARSRPFSRTAYLPDAGVDKLSASTLPANIVGPTPGSLLNPSYASGCAPPQSIPYVFGGNAICGFDYASVIDTVPPVEQTNVIARATYQLAAGHQLFGEFVYGYSNLLLRGSPTPTFQGVYPADGPFYPTAFAVANGLSGDLDMFYRTISLGPRTDEVRTQAWRALVGLEGTLGRWSYSAAYDHSEDKATDTFTSGYASRTQFASAMATGLVNPFGPSGSIGDALLQSTQISGASRTAKGTMDQLDARASAEIYSLPAGPLALAVGAEGRRERLADQPASAQVANDVLGGVAAISPQSSSRTVEALFVEFNVPIAKVLEAQLSVRYDHFSDFGSTTNPKLALRWQPATSLLLRGSWGTGFRAPSLPDLHTAQTTSLAGGDLDNPLEDPERCPVTKLPSDCGLDFYAVRFGGNPKLAPETSTQWTAGIVWEPVAGTSIGLDYWNIDKRNVIDSLNDGLIFDHFDVYGQTNVIRGPLDPAYPNLPGPIQTLIEYNQNVGNQQTSGIDVTLRARSPVARLGRLMLQVDGTYISHWVEALSGLPSESVVGRAGPFGPVPRWRHYASLQWEFGPWRATVAQMFQSGYIDQNPDANDNPRRVGTYSVWDLQGTYAGWRNATLTLGIRNLFDRAPPFTNQTDTFQVGYDPAYGDPRGRTFYARLTYALK